jgi:sigma-B regulation protein RsbU (phosphoserine phosphatase)
VGAGELEARAQLGGSPEFHELSAALNGMIAQLQDRLRLRNSIAVARQVQSKLLPAGPPKVCGLDIAGHSTYCDETGGDYYDFLTFDQNHAQLFVTIGDVIGHGVGAALPMAGARAVLRTRAPTGLTPGKLLGELNQLLCEDFDGSGFMTMLIAVLDPQRMTIRWANAGHDPILVYDPLEDQFFELEGADLPLGISREITYGDLTSDRLRPGQVLVLGTDGVWEAANVAGELFGKDRLRETIRSAAACTAAQIGAAIERDVDAFRGAAPRTDDMTFVVIKMLDRGNG